MTKREIEHRLIPFNQFELRETNGKPAELVGHAAVFNQETVIESWWSEWREIIAPGAFKKTIQENDIRALFNHNPDIVLGRNKAGTLELREDEVGLYTVIRPPDNEWGAPVVDAIRRGDITGMSIALSVIKEDVVYPEKDSNELMLRTIREAKLYDISPVTFPAYEQTDISARSAIQQGLAEKDLLLTASALARKAQHGYQMTSEERRLIADAIELLNSVTREPVPDDHSPQAGETEPDTNHSAEARERRLRIMNLILRGEA